MPGSVSGRSGPIDWRELGGAEGRAVREFYRQGALDGSACVLVVDAYNKVYGRERASVLESVDAFPSTCGEAGWDALPASRAVLAAARARKVPVLYTTGITNPAGGRRPTQRVSADSGWDLRIVDALRPEPDEVVLAKPAANAFYGTTLDALLRSMRAEVLILLGETTSGCVRATAIDAFNLGFSVVVVEDAVFDRFPVSHAASLFDLDLKYARVLPSATVAAAMSAPGRIRLPGRRPLSPAHGPVTADKERT